VASAAALGFAMLAAAPAQAGPAESETVTDIFAQWPDDQNELVVFANSTRASYCTPAMVQFELAVIAWDQGGQVGPFPEPPVYVAPAPMTVTAKDVGQNTRFSFQGTVPIELWTFEGGKGRDNIGVGACTDTDGVLDGSATPVAPSSMFAAGSGKWTFKDNDEFGDGPRSNVWGDTIRANVSGPTGEYAYTIVFRNHTQACTDNGTEDPVDDYCHIDEHSGSFTLAKR